MGRSNHKKRPLAGYRALGANDINYLQRISSVGLSQPLLFVGIRNRINFYFGCCVSVSLVCAPHTFPLRSQFDQRSLCYLNRIDLFVRSQLSWFFARTKYKIYFLSFFPFFLSLASPHYFLFFCVTIRQTAMCVLVQPISESSFRYIHFLRIILGARRSHIEIERGRASETERKNKTGVCSLCSPL